MVSEDFPSVGKKEQSQSEKKDWQERAPSSHPKEKERASRVEGRDKGKDKEKATQNERLEDDFERTPSGRVRRRSAQVAVFHLQEIAEDELAKDWGTKRRIKDDLVPDSKRVRPTSCQSKVRPKYRGYKRLQCAQVTSLRTTGSIVAALQNSFRFLFVHPPG